MQRCNDQETFNDCLTPMQRLATAGMSILLPHYLHRNGDLDSVSHDFGCFFGMDCLRIRISHTSTSAERRWRHGAIARMEMPSSCALPTLA
jgi:hypothetical protein